MHLMCTCQSSTFDCRPTDSSYATSFTRNHLAMKRSGQLNIEALGYEDGTLRGWGSCARKLVRHETAARHTPLRYNRQKQAIGDETDDTFVKPQAVDDVPFAGARVSFRMYRCSSSGPCAHSSGHIQGPVSCGWWSPKLCYPATTPSVMLVCGYHKM